MKGPSREQPDECLTEEERKEMQLKLECLETQSQMQHQEGMQLQPVSMNEEELLPPPEADTTKVRDATHKEAASPLLISYTSVCLLSPISEAA